MQAGSTIDVYSTVAIFFKNLSQNFNNVFVQSMNLLCTIKHPSRLHDVKFCKRVNGEGEVMLAGGEDHKTTVYSVPKDAATSPIVIAEMIGHSNRLVFYPITGSCQNAQLINITG